MELRTINWRDEIIALFPEYTERKKEDKEQWCATCGGLGLKRAADYIIGCHTCSGTGKVKSDNCECDQPKEKGWAKCKECRIKADIAKERLLFEKATKIRYADYEGHFMDKETVMDKDELAEIIMQRLFDGEDAPDYWWAAETQPQIVRLDLSDTIYELCEGSYEGIMDNLDLGAPEIIEAQKLLDKWLVDNKSALTVYWESTTTAVLIGDLVTSLREEKEADL